jgi:hypothetical protein
MRSPFPQLSINRFNRTERVSSFFALITQYDTVFFK